MSLLRRAMLRASAETVRSGGLLALYLALHGHAWPNRLPNPFLKGGFAPVRDELTVEALPVRGELPKDLAGVYLRNGPNPEFKPLSYTFPFDGDGMVHALALQEGRASYRNRFVLTPGLRAEQRAGRALYGGMLTPRWPDPALIGPDGDPSPFKNTANTNVIHHGGRTLALWEGGLPIELGPDLRTIGPCDFNGQVRTAFTAHPQTDPHTGELLAFRYVPTPPYLFLIVIDPTGQHAREIPIDVAAPFMVHDFTVTPRYAIFFLCPTLIDPASAIRGRRLLSWEPERGTCIALVPRDGCGPVRWFRTDPFFVFHFMNAFEQAERIAVDYVQHASFGGGMSTAMPSLWRMELDPATGLARRSQLCDHIAEFPRIDRQVAGRRNRYGWMPLAGRHRGPASTFSAVARYDFLRGDVAVHDFGQGQEMGEPVFIPRPGADPSRRAEGDGWIGAYVYDLAADATRFVLLDAVDIVAPPLAEIMLPRRVPHGFHGNWIEGAALAA
ncbi:Dioxygenase [Rhodovastum atsumiense]|uniref:Dioxygenase n=1 Tax=Rhodovastum atsumiense TaxID=504468 RepID=A0A5M6IND0_9PROT|nr:carotenoid oxygenase family protein [Rhodovastum atsumiense]KAA5609766.1 carotenoid oxygenase family protein [Rhodovastum atsumiense]CAH2599455.1 Dioxygenase [Rhodovastum atsumiense]